MTEPRPEDHEPDAVEIEAPGGHRWTVLWLHGLGADGHDFEPLVPELGLAADHGIRFVFPHAAYRPVTVNNGMSMRAWYDIASPELAREEDEAGIRASITVVRKLVAREGERGIPPGRIVLGGFSQGGAIALAAGLRHDDRLGGIAVLSGYLPLASRLAEELDPANHDTPVFQAHGSDDPIVPVELASATRDRIAALRPAPEWHTYPVAHSVCGPEIHALREWLTGTVGAA